MHKMLTFTAILHKEEDLYVAECPEVGTASQGYSIEEALANLQEATEVYLEEFPDTVPDTFSFSCRCFTAKTRRRKEQPNV